VHSTVLFVAEIVSTNFKGTAYRNNYGINLKDDFYPSTKFWTIAHVFSLRPSAFSICAHLREILFLNFLSQIYADFFLADLRRFLFLRPSAVSICAPLRELFFGIFLADLRWFISRWFTQISFSASICAFQSANICVNCFFWIFLSQIYTDIFLRPLHRATLQQRMKIICRIHKTIPSQTVQYFVFVPIRIFLV